MPDQSDVERALVALVDAVRVQAGASWRVYRGWPDPQMLDADLAAEGGDPQPPDPPPADSPVLPDFGAIVPVGQAQVRIGTASIELGAGDVEADTYAVIPSAPYRLTPIAVEYEAGEGGTFIADLVWLPDARESLAQSAGASGLRAAAGHRQTHEIPVERRVTLPVRDRLAFRIRDVAGAPTGALLTVHFAR